MNLDNLTDDELYTPAVLNRISCIAERKLNERGAFRNPEDTKQHLLARLRSEEREVFGVIFLDTQHRQLDLQVLFYGTIDGASVYPREVIKSTLALNAAALILFHNHPSGEPEPSLADKQITRRLIDALALIDVRVLDHIIVGQGSAVSFAARGLL